MLGGESFLCNWVGRAFHHQVSPRHPLFVTNSNMKNESDMYDSIDSSDLLDSHECCCWFCEMLTEMETEKALSKFPPQDTLELVA